MCFIFSSGLVRVFSFGGMYILTRKPSLAAAGARRRRGGRLLAAALVRAGHQLPVDDRVRVALAFEARPSDRRVVGVRGVLLDAQMMLSQSEYSVNEFPGALTSRACTAG